MKIITQNKKASHDYFITDKYEAGIKLTGTEIKSIRQSNCNINDAYVQIKQGVATIINMFVGKYDHGNIFNHEERRSRELLLHRREINKLVSKVKLEGIALIPTKLYFVGSLVKVEFGLAKGKKNYDKREDLKQKDAELRIKKAIKNSMYD